VFRKTLLFLYLYEWWANKRKSRQKGASSVRPHVTPMTHELRIVPLAVEALHKSKTWWSSSHADCGWSKQGQQVPELRSQNLQLIAMCISRNHENFWYAGDGRAVGHDKMDRGEGGLPFAAEQRDTAIYVVAWTNLTAVVQTDYTFPFPSSCQPLPRRHPGRLWYLWREWRTVHCWNKRTKRELQ